MRPKPLAHIVGARDDGTVQLPQVDQDLTGIDSQYQFWSLSDGSLDTLPPAAGRRAAVEQ